MFDIINSLIYKYKEDFVKHDLNDRDFIFFRCIFKEFVVRENIKGSNTTFYGRYKIIDNFPDEIVNEKVLLVQSYSIEKDKFDFIYSARVKLTHKDPIVNCLDSIIDIYDKEGSIKRLLKLNLYDIPIYVYDPDSNKYIRISSIKNRITNNQLYQIIVGIYSDIANFNAFNYHMLCKFENKEDIDFLKSDNTIVRSSLVEYMKYEAHEDKKIRIKIDNDVNLNLYTKNDNIYSHDNKVVRKLCDYRFMVSAHWHHYWVGSKKDGSAHRIRKWVESYEKNKGKQHKIIREMYKGKEEAV